MNNDDKLICEQIIQGNQQAFRLLYQRYRNLVYGYTIKLTTAADVAEEAVQEIFMKIWINRATLDPARSLEAYLYKSTRNFVFNYLKKALHDEKIRRHFFESTPQTAVPTDKILLVKELEIIRSRAISSLPPQRQLIFRLSRINGLSNQEIAVQLGISGNTVKDQLVKASKAIKVYMIKHAELAVALAMVALS
ncbi:RNA polymerase sigma-70 factor [Chitinophaga nivalis]|uniref:RNA polymerase sigma-70 factor n=1 Tax=Chitinophaga nivalis TaxID=2991709 RepID=A0ABT3IF49_9BACT|nr:RNA polymerase sigma-70 factor [Chitinophaga nivalis]MCW3467727.1 RNA polymerase sigma-70 factor [Chitinophaga nivalis]MCW3482581.1 RNA polymerase sigma-70 factor [Chitinophaga nivalis]